MVASTDCARSSKEGPAATPTYLGRASCVADQFIKVFSFSVCCAAKYCSSGGILRPWSSSGYLKA